MLRSHHRHHAGDPGHSAGPTRAGVLQDPGRHVRPPVTRLSCCTATTAPQPQLSSRSAGWGRPAAHGPALVLADVRQQLSLSAQLQRSTYVACCRNGTLQQLALDEYLPEWSLKSQLVRRYGIGAPVFFIMSIVGWWAYGNVRPQSCTALHCCPGWLCTCQQPCMHERSSSSDRPGSSSSSRWSRVCPTAQIQCTAGQAE